MNRQAIRKTVLGIFLVAALLAIGAAGGLWWATRQAPAAHPHAAAPAPDGRTVLYWYDPMVPQHRFDQPGPSPFMDMDLVPRYADEGGAATTVRIDPGMAQNLGVRLASVVRAPFGTDVQASGVVGFNEREVVVVQARSGGFVERAARLAPNDVIRSGAFIAELLVPQWAAVQQEYLALKALGDAALESAARDRMRLAGMPEDLISEIAASGKVRNRIAITAPRGGVIQELEVRAGMTLMAGQTLARINGIDSVWLDVAVPQARAGAVQVGQAAEAHFAAFPGEPVQGRVSALLPTLNEAARTLRVRVELPNKDGRLRPGLTAQVSLQGSAVESALRVPTEAVIRTGKRALVIVAEAEGRFRPVEVVLGPESGNDTVIRSGLDEGQKVVASGQFLIDSEASLLGITARFTDAPATPVTLHEADAVIEAISAAEVLLAHGPFKTLPMPGMTMEFPLARPELAQGLQVGDRVRVGVRQTDAGLLVEKIGKINKTEEAK